MSTTKRSTRRSQLKSHRPSKMSSKHSANSSASDGQSPVWNALNLKTPTEDSASHFTLLTEWGHRKHLFISFQTQAAAAFLIVSLAVYVVLEPALALNFDIFGSLGPSSRPSKVPTFSWRLGYVLLNSCYSLGWVLGLELYKEYLRMVSYIRSRTRMSLDDQMKLNGRIKMIERMHSRSLSQFLLMLFCQLSFIFDLKLILILERIVPTFNYIYLLGRIVDIFQPKRLKLFVTLIVYIPVLACLLFNVKRKLYTTYKALFE